MSNCNTWGLWNGLKSLAGYETKNNSICWSGLNVNEVNKFFARLDELDFSVSHDMILESLVQSGNVNCNPAIIINENELRQQLKCLKTNKAAGPDDIRPHTLKVCADQLCSVFHSLFSLSLASSKIPVMWKTLCLVPIPKHGNRVLV